MKKLVLFAAALLLAGQASAGSPRRLKSLGEVMEALKKGNSVRTVIEYKKCTLQALKKQVEKLSEPADPSETTDKACALSVQNKPRACYYAKPESLDAVGGMQFGTWEYFAPGFVGPKGYIAASDSKLISLRGFVLNYGSVRLYDDNTVSVRVNYLKTADDHSGPPAQETPLSFKKDTGEVAGKKVLQHEYVVVMDEQFDCAVSDGRDGKGASFFAAP